ncbi:hypothetical protein BJ878DRAFT_206497 [Calycina marina]|uniref:Uncharacterized protein n=1 Tax=Calycina marina TaxID=1763456 RepID=A0A9P8CE08_9HELO|nr:hypothetical protein BJ878DRAFT_206497 [Calycina marina]
MGICDQVGCFVFLMCCEFTGGFALSAYSSCCTMGLGSISGCDVADTVAEASGSLWYSVVYFDCIIYYCYGLKVVS